MITRIIQLILVRSLFFLTTLNLWTTPKVIAFIWTYPLINFVVISYTVSSHWVYDLMRLMYANQNPVQLRRQMSVFVIAVIVFIVIMYLVYMLSLPIETDLSDLPGIFYFLAIFEWIVAAILMCSIFLYVKRIHNISP